MTSTGLAVNHAGRNWLVENILARYPVMMDLVLLVTRKAFNSAHVNAIKKSAIVLNLNGNVKKNAGKSWDVDIICAKWFVMRENAHLVL